MLSDETRRKIADLASTTVPIDLELIDDHGLTGILSRLGLLKEGVETAPTAAELARFLESAGGQIKVR